MCPNLHDPKAAARVVREGRVDVVSMARPLLAAPPWPNKVRQGRADEIKACILCNGCLSTLFQGFSTRCTLNPNVGGERFVPEYFPPPRKGGGRPIGRGGRG
jgi:2,4-dienoyl-CoA reductase (NADPH2)